MNFINSIINSFKTGVIIAIAIVVLVIIANVSRRKKAIRAAQEAQRIREEEARRRQELAEEESAAQLAREEELKKNDPTVSIPETIGGKQIAYSYHDVKLASAGVPCSLISPADPLTLKENGDAVEAWQGDLLLGTLPKNRLSGMVHDWNENGDPVLSYIAFYSDDGSDVQIHLVFYADQLARFRDRHPEAKSVRLTGKPEEFASPSVGASCEVEYDDEKEKYSVVLNGDILGYLPASATKYAEDRDISPEDLDVIISAVDYDVEKEYDLITVLIGE